MKDYNPLWKLNKNYLLWLEKVEENDGEIDDELNVQLTELESEVSETLETYYNMIEEMKGTIGNREELVKRMEKQTARDKVLIAKFEERIDYLVRKHGKEEITKTKMKSYSFTTNDLGIKINLTPSKALKVYDEDLDTYEDKLLPYLSGVLTVKTKDVKALKALRQRILNTGIAEDSIALSKSLDKTVFKKALDDGLEFEGGTSIVVNHKINFK